MTSSKIGKALKELDKKDKVCEWRECKKEFIGSGKAKYCSNACRQKAKRDRAIASTH